MITELLKLADSLHDHLYLPKVQSVAHKLRTLAATLPDPKAEPVKADALRTLSSEWRSKGYAHECTRCADELDAFLARLPQQGESK